MNSPPGNKSYKRPPEPPYELALFAGAGGGIIAGELLGWRCIGAVEWEAYPAGVLMQKQNSGIFPPFPIWDDVRTFTKRNNETRGFIRQLCKVRDRLIISGGFPCQDISSAGTGEGIHGERSGMWSEMGRIIGEIRPRIAYIENSPMLVVRGIDRVLCDLAALGYDAKWGVLSAADVGAPHRRERIWIVADRDKPADDPGFGKIETAPPGRTRPRAHTHADRERCDRDPNHEVSTRRNPAKSCFHIVPDPDSFRELESTDSGQQGGDGFGNDGQELADTMRSGRGTIRTRRPLGADSQQRPPAAGILDTENPRLQGIGETRQGEGKGGEPETWRGFAGILSAGVGDRSWWAIEPDVGRVAHGVAARVDRLKAIGNGQVPLCAAKAYKILTRG